MVLTIKYHGFLFDKDPKWTHIIKLLKYCALENLNSPKLSECLELGKNAIKFLNTCEVTTVKYRGNYKKGELWEYGRKVFPFDALQFQG